jgi:hypothetical protein
MFLREKQKESGTVLASKARQIHLSALHWFRAIMPVQRPVQRPVACLSVIAHLLSGKLALVACSFAQLPEQKYALAMAGGVR